MGRRGRIGFPLLMGHADPVILPERDTGGLAGD